MVLIDCPKCRRRMTVTVPNCPGCGTALERKKDRLRRPVIVDVVVFLGASSLLGWFLWWLLSGPSF
jgi:hypothetical protein